MRRTISLNDAQDSYDEVLDTYGPVKIGSITFDASYVLRELDPIAYRTGLDDYIDSQEWDIE